ncbi:Aste57867_23602 [Aphanomyces stellatus]|uniref:Aste57867_23602 protein n=1 Tax=Aphanomyces stellatus TaxID=120398 RepID=A0A485LNY8_9STRA|nr:hypothetical protein As57867_023530 [Aphanomyces stellatus]VFU00247.1 Aste57867_23602 [Aphanomyces stellatus]
MPCGNGSLVEAISDFDHGIALEPSKSEHIRYYYARAQAHMLQCAYNLSTTPNPRKNCLYSRRAQAIPVEDVESLACRGTVCMHLAKESQANSCIPPSRPTSVFCMTSSTLDPMYGLLAHGPYRNPDAITLATRALADFHHAHRRLDATQERDQVFALDGFGSDQVRKISHLSPPGNGGAPPRHAIHSHGSIESSHPIGSEPARDIKWAQLHLERHCMEEAIMDLNTMIQNGKTNSREVRMGLLCRTRIFIQWPSDRGGIDEARVDLQRILDVEPNCHEATLGLQDAQGRISTKAKNKKVQGKPGEQVTVPQVPRGVDGIHSDNERPQIIYGVGGDDVDDQSDVEDEANDAEQEAILTTSAVGPSGNSPCMFIDANRGDDMSEIVQTDEWTDVRYTKKKSICARNSKQILQSVQSTGR